MELIKFAQFRKALTSQSFFIWHSLDDVVINDEDTIDNFWDEDIQEVDTTASQVIAATFGYLSSLINKKIEIERDVIYISGSLEEKIKQTTNLLSSGKTLIGAAFQYDDMVSLPHAFDTNLKTIININYSKKTKLKNFAKAFFDYEIISKVTKVDDYNIYLPLDIEAKKGELEIHCVDEISKGKTGHLPGYFNTKGESPNINVIEALTSANPEVDFPLFDTVINKIRNAINVKEISDNLIEDNTQWGANTQWDSLLQKLGHKLTGFSGKIHTKKKIVNNDDINSSVYDKLQEITSPIINDIGTVERMMQKIDDAKKVVWYDFEGFSLPYAAVDNTKGYSQMVFQVSIINTINSEEQKPLNMVWDPKKLNKDDFFEIMTNVYQDRADIYVVYNKGYENARLKEFVKLLERENDSRSLQAQQMFEHIDDNTIDLFDLFRISGANKLPPILLHDQKGKASIKNIEKHINLNHLSEKINYKIKEYTSLNIQKGNMAMEVAIKRALNIIGDKEWVDTMDDLKEYCENDVKAMLMVYHFIKYLLTKEEV